MPSVIPATISPGSQAARYSANQRAGGNHLVFWCFLEAAIRRNLSFQYRVRQLARLIHVNVELP
jgi:hypothetical protein